MSKKNNAKMIDADTYLQAGIDPKTKKPKRCDRKEDFLRFLRIIDLQDATNRYKWTGIPCDLSSQEIERLIYYKGQLVFFYFKDLKKFYLMPYALDGTIDFYGRYNRVHPVPFASGADEENDANFRTQADVLSLIKLNVKYDVVTPEELMKKPDIMTKCGVLLHDYTKQISQNIIPRSIVNECLLDECSDLYCYLDINMLIGTGVVGYRVNDADSRSEVDEMAAAVYNAAVNRRPYIAVEGQMDFQDMNHGNQTKSEDYLLAIQALDNLRLSSYGIENGGLYEKKAHLLETESAINNANVQNAYQDGLSIRQHFCEICNSIWGLSMWCEANESVVKADLNGDGLLYDNETESDPKMMQQGGDANE